MTFYVSLNVSSADLTVIQVTLSIVVVPKMCARFRHSGYTLVNLCVERKLKLGCDPNGHHSI